MGEATTYRPGSMAPEPHRRAGADRATRGGDGDDLLDRHRVCRCDRVGSNGVHRLADVDHDGQAAIAEGAPFVEVGDPVFFEPLAVATDKSAPEHAALMEELDRIVQEMHDDGSLSSLSEQWFDGADYSVTE